MSKQPANLARQDYANQFNQPQTAPQYNIGDANARIKRVGSYAMLENDVESMTTSGLTGTNQAANAKWDGSNWNRIDTAQPASRFVVLRTGDIQIYAAPAGANPISWSGPYPVVKEDGSGIIASEAWIAPTLLNGWVNYDTTFNPAGYYKDKLGIVHLRGLVKSGTVGATIFNLPVGYRPAYTELKAAMTDPNAIGRVDVTAAGDVVMAAGSNVWFSLDNVSFRAA